MAGLSVVELARRLGGSWKGDANAHITGVAALADAGADQLSFYVDSRYRGAARETQAAAVLVAPDNTAIPEQRALVVEDPRRALFDVLRWLHAEHPVEPGIHPAANVEADALVDPTARVGAFASIGRGVVIGAGSVIETGSVIEAGAKIGRDTTVGANTVVGRGAIIGDRVVVGPGCAVGRAGFGYSEVDGEPRRLTHAGTVVLEDDVELGANCTVDRALVGETRIGHGTKVDSLVHIAHGVTIGAGCFITALCGIAGSARLGDSVEMGGQSGVTGHVTVPAGTRIAAQAGVMKSVGETQEPLTGIPARPLTRVRRAEAELARLPELRRRVSELERQLRLLAGTQ